MRLNTLKPAVGAKKTKKRRGRGWSSGLGKTSGRGQKGQRARNTVPVGFEGGQMPFHRRVPKSGFSSWKARVTTEIRLPELAKVKAEKVDLQSLREAGLINKSIKFAKVILNGEINQPVVISPEIKVTKGARAAIEAAGGKVEE